MSFIYKTENDTSLSNGRSVVTFSYLIFKDDAQVGISIFKVLMQITRPKTVMLGNIPGTDIFRDLHHYRDAMTVPGFLILSIEAPINFANATYLKERLGIAIF